MTGESGMERKMDYNVTEDRTWVTDHETGAELSVREVARMARVSPGTVRRWFQKGERRRDLRTWGELADFLLRHDAQTVRNMAFIERQEAEKRARR